MKKIIISIIIEKTSTGYSAYVLNIPDPIITVAPTISQIKINIQEGFKFLENMENVENI